MSRSAASWWNDRPLWAKGTVVLALPLAVLLGLTVMLLDATRAAEREALAFEQATAVSAAADELLNDTLAAEAGVHAFVLTEDPAMLGRYEQALDELPADLETLRALLKSEPERKWLAEQVASLLDLRLDQLELLLAKDAFDGSHFQMLSGVQTSDEISSVVASLDEAEAEEVRDAEAQRRRAARRAEITALLGIALALIGGVVGSVVFALSISRRVRRNQENAERLIEGREMLPAPSGRDEVGRSGIALVEAAHILAERDRKLKESEAEQRRERELLKAILDQMGEGVVVADEAGSFVVFNPAAEEIVGVAAADAGPSGWSEHDAFASVEARDPLLPDELPLTRAMRGEPTDDLMLQVRSPDGSEGAHISVNGRPLRDAEGSVRGGLVVFRDVTQAREQGLRLEEYRHDLERSNEELERFAYVASHDLQEPLRMVASHVQLLAGDLEGTLGPDQQESMAFAVDGAKRMQRLINDLLTYSRVGRRGKPFVPTEMDGVLMTALLNLEVAIQEGGATVTSDELPVLSVDAGQLVQLLQNLIGNAIKFHGNESPHVHVGADFGDGEWTFTVEDNGIGIPEEHAERVFQIFQRLHSRSEYEGTGIGLAVCRRIVERHGGRIWIEPGSPKGTRFRFTIPGTSKQLAA